jgi:hypothetical protein
MADANEDRFFVTIRAGSVEGLAEVRGLGLDLFGTTAKAGDEVTIEGLLTLEDVGRVVTAGHEVVVHRHADTMARAQEQSASAEEWLAEIGGQ